MTRVLHIDGPGPTTVNVADYDVVVFHTPAAREIVGDGRLSLYPMAPDHADPDLMRVRFVEVRPETEQISARQSWKDPWPGGRRR